MSGQVQFDGMVPFLDRNTNQPVQVRVWGAFVGQGIDAHEVEPIRAWILNALAQSAQTYDGQISALPGMAQEWGGYVSQQLNPQLSQQFQAHGQIQIHGISLDGGGGAQKQPAPMKQDPVAAKAAMAGAAMGGAAMGGAAMGAGFDSGLIQQAAQALSSQMGVPFEDAHKAARIVAQTLAGGGGAVGAGYESAAKQQAYAEHQKNLSQPGYDASAAKKQAYGEPVKQGYDKQAQNQSYDKQAAQKPGYDKQSYDKQAQNQSYDKQAYDKQAQNQSYDKQAYDKQAAQKPGYDKQAQNQAYDKQAYDKQAYEKQQYGGGKDPGYKK